MNFKQEYHEKVEYIENVLREYLPVTAGEQAIIMEAMGYSLSLIHI